jgi:hypothetical protein
MKTVPRTSAPRAALCAALSCACLLNAAAATREPPVSGPLGGGESVSLEPAPPPASPRRHRAVYVCQESGVPVYTDRPCGTAIATRSLVVDAPRPGAAASTSPPAPRAATRPRVRTSKLVVPTEPAIEDRCARHQRRLDELNDRMRAGYSAREAARLWQQWRDAKERLRTARC